jgi:hypothetical protein
MTTTQTIQILSITTSLLASGGIASLSSFSIPLLRSQPASRSLPQLRWLFSRGSHIFPSAALLSSIGFLYLAYTALPLASPSSSSLSALLAHATSGKPALYLAASLLSFSIAPFTSFVMVPTNFTLIARNEELGGARSAAAAEHREASQTQTQTQSRSAEESVNGKNDISQWSDLSDPQARTEESSTPEQNGEVKGLLTKFEGLNYVRAGLMGMGGLVGLVGALV